MTELQRKQQTVRDLQLHAAYAKHNVREHQHKLADSNQCLEEINKDGKAALFDLYVSSSHRSFMKFLRENEHG
ncbi:MAG: hypothetical protein GQ532_18330 [Methylomarinum sp.]|nr:hypothetical protein [Methylomarinum sp.]